MTKNFFRRRAFLLSLGSLTAGILNTLNKPGQALDSKRELVTINESPLKKRATAKGLIYGAFGGGYKNFVKDTQFRSDFVQECELLTTGFYCKNIRPSVETFNFTETDFFAKFASDNTMLFRGHPLVWHNLNPQWLIDKFKKSNTNSREIESILTNHISTVVKRYAGQVHSWDVVNEAINVSDGRADGLRDTKISGDREGKKYPNWLHFLGTEYIDLAFRVAAKADPQTLLVYSDYGFDYDTPQDEAKRVAVLKLLYRLKAIGTPVDIFGIHAHLRGSESRFNPTKLRNFLRHVGSLDLKIMITELDVSDQGLPQDIDERDRQVAQHYYDYLSVVLDEPAVIGVLTWGLSDRYTWLSNHRPRADGLPVRPLPLDRDLNRKPAWYAIAKAFDNAPNRAFK